MITSHQVLADRVMAETYVPRIGFALWRESLAGRQRPARWIAGLSYAASAALSVTIWAGIVRLVWHFA